MHPRELYFFKKGELESRYSERNRLMALIADDRLLGSYRFTLKLIGSLPGRN